MMHPLDDNATRALLEQRHEKLARYGRPPRRRQARRQPLTAVLRSLLARTAWGPETATTRRLSSTP